MSEIIVSARDLTKTYRLYAKPHYRFLDVIGMLRGNDKYSEHHALHSMDLDIRRGEKVAIIGRNGAGKSTLLKLITRVIEPTSGSLEIKGETQALLQIGTGFHPDFTGRQNVYSYLAHLGFSGKEADERVAEIIEFSELEEYIDQPVKTYSTGMGMRLMFSASTAIHPDILVIDEVLSVGDAYFVNKSFTRIEEMCAKEDTTLILVSHDISRAGMLCDRFIWIEDGRVRLDSSAKMVSNRYALSIREQEEKRLRSIRVRAEIARSEESQQGGNTTGIYAIGHVRCKGGMPLPADLPIKTILIRDDKGNVASLDSGDQALFDGLEMILEPGEGNWSEVKAFHDIQSRAFARHGSIYHKAPFLIKNIKIINSFDDASRINCQLKYFDCISETILVEIFPNSASHLCFRGELPLQGTMHWAEAEIELTKTDKAEPAAPKTRFGAQLFYVDNVRFVNQSGQETHVFRIGEKFEVHMDYVIADPKFNSKPVIQVSFARDGVRIARMILDDHQFDYTQSRRGSLSGIFDPIRLGPGEYVVSIAVMAEGGYSQNVPSRYFSANPNLLDHHTRGYQIRVEATGKILLDDVACVLDAQWVIDDVIPAAAQPLLSIGS